MARHSQWVGKIIGEINWFFRWCISVGRTRAFLTFSSYTKHNTIFDSKFFSFFSTFTPPIQVNISNSISYWKVANCVHVWCIMSANIISLIAIQIKDTETQWHRQNKHDKKRVEQSDDILLFVLWHDKSEVLSKSN